MKKIIFFDGDGTLWYPESTGHTIAPQWIYADKEIGSNYLKHMVVIPPVLEILKKLKKQRLTMVILSTHPHSPKEAIKVLKAKIDYFQIGNFFDSYHALQADPDQKGKMILKILKEKGIPKSQALMIGDSYRYDYLSAQKVGVDALLIKTPYMKHPPRGPKISKTIKSIKEVLNYL